jgi:hypothetical protein
MKKLLFAASLLLTSTALSCDSGDGFKIPKPKDLEPGGVYVAYNIGCKVGCDQIAKGDLIQKIDGKEVKTGKDFDDASVIDGKPHELEILSADTKVPKVVKITATGKDNMPPLEDVPPFWTVGAESLNEAPTWARRRMFGHASPMVMLVSADGGILDGRQLFGKPRLMVYWDHGTRVEQAQAVTFLQVLQKAQADLKAAGVDVMFVQVKFPGGRQEPLNDSDLRAFQEKWTVKAEDGSPYPPVKMYRFPNATEFNRAREIGMEGAFTVFENLGASPTILMLDERGIVRWHSERVTEPVSDSEVKDPAQYTIIQAVLFAQNQLKKL